MKENKKKKFKKFAYTYNFFLYVYNLYIYIFLISLYNFNMVVVVHRLKCFPHCY